MSNVSAQEMVAGMLIGIERLVHFLGLTKAVKSVKYRDFSFTKHIFNYQITLFTNMALFQNTSSTTIHTVYQNQKIALKHFPSITF